MSAWMGTSKNWKGQWRRKIRTDFIFLYMGFFSTWNSITEKTFWGTALLCLSSLLRAFIIGRSLRSKPRCYTRVLVAPRCPTRQKSESTCVTWWSHKIISIHQNRQHSASPITLCQVPLCKVQLHLYLEHSLYAFPVSFFCKLGALWMMPVCLNFATSYSTKLLRAPQKLCCSFKVRNS